MRRREFIAGLASAAAWPLVARAQQGRVMRRIGVFSNLTADDPEAQTRNAAFLQGLQELGWTVGPLQRATPTVPIVFANVTDPVGAGFIDSLARPGGHTTEF